MITINDRIKEFYTSLNLSQEEFAEKIGASQQYISAVVNGKRNAGSSILKRIKLAFPDVDYVWLLDGEDKNTGAKMGIEQIGDVEFVSYLIKNTERLLDNNIYFRAWYENIQYKSSKRSKVE